MRWGCGNASCLDTCAEPGTCGVRAAIAVATVPPSSSSARHPRDSLGCGDAPARGGGDGGAGAIAATAPPGLIYTAEASLVEIPRFPWRRGLIPRVLSIPGEAG